MELTIRKAQSKDSQFLFNLRNEESVRAVSLNSDLISLDTHQQWFRKRLVNPNSIIYISESDFVPIAQTRYEVSGEEAEVSIAVVKEFRGKGYGSEILKKTASHFFKDFPEVRTVKAFINLGNEASVHSFRKAGYQYVGRSKEGGLERDKFVLIRD